MKYIVGFSRLFVGVLFMFSGFVKLNDPVGFSYKLEEYFGVGVLNLEFLVPYALVLAIFIVIYELLLGLTLLIGYAPKFTRWSLLLMILFFTFLTFYSAYFNKVTDCGCFGDAIPLTPWQSFGKDVILLILILILFFNEKYLNPIFAKASLKWVVFAATITCLYFAYHVLMHLPAIDFRAYKIGTNIPEAISYPENAKKAVYEYEWTFDVNGSQETHITTGSYPEVAGEFIGVETRLIEEGYKPPIHDFALMKDGEDYTEELMQEDKLLIVVTYNLSKTEREGWPEIVSALQKASKQNFKIIGLTASGQKDISRIKSDFDLDFNFYFADETTIKTIVRANPGLVVLKKGTITNKLHWSDADEFQN
ncbi:DoxX family protein [Psychroflexus sp. CAK57W]|uniref:BT_3928 family protein n=1 Tax=Psychroflexus curvus TaxID=2873595 RepID=UPI001CCFEC79|nr:BT_3928 family protein [Psychroflexus curvus]MBZ9628636.1 DoxX family protein [Psychroflexus curvus]MBZ9787918.1 DoxX family protein [Psychroflexus curvus]